MVWYPASMPVAAILHQRGLPHRAHGVHHPYDNEHQEPCQQGPG